MIVCKYFEGARVDTQLWIAVLTTCFENVSLVKPTTSRATNSERYVICRSFIEYKDVINTRYTVSELWREDLQEVIDKHALQQANSLKQAFAFLKTFF
tara:strand:- start:192 stop:485 length:294 start_codon:yes stop_codon:yes gene_type:complete